MTQIQFANVSIPNVMEILHALRDTDYVQDVDYWFTYYKAEFEMHDVNISDQKIQYVGAQKTPNRVVFTVVDSAVAAWFVLRFGGTVVSDEECIDDKSQSE